MFFFTHLSSIYLFHPKPTPTHWNTCRYHIQKLSDFSLSTPCVRSAELLQISNMFKINKTRGLRIFYFFFFRKHNLKKIFALFTYFLWKFKVFCFCFCFKNLHYSHLLSFVILMLNVSELSFTLSSNVLTKSSSLYKNKNKKKNTHSRCRRRSFGSSDNSQVTNEIRMLYCFVVFLGFVFLFFFFFFG